MSAIFRIFLCALLVKAAIAGAQPGFLPASLAGSDASELRGLEPLVWSDPWSARERLMALRDTDAPPAYEAARNLLLAQSLIYLHRNDELAEAVAAGNAALDDDSPARLHHYLAVLDGVSAARQGDLDGALERLATAAAEAREADLGGIAVLATAELGYAHTHAGNYEQAELVLQEAAEEALSRGDPFLVAVVDEIYGVLYAYLDEYDRAIRYFRQALAAYEALSYPVYVAEAVYGLATAHRYGGDPEAALAAFRRYRDIMTAHGDAGGRFSALYGLGMTHAEMGNCEAALPVIAEALGAGGPADYDAELLKRAAVCHARQGDAAAAMAALDRAQDIIGGMPELTGTRWDIGLDKAEADMYAALGVYDKAYRALDRYQARQSALQRENASERRLSQRAALENARQALQIELLQEQARVRSLEIEQQQRELRSERLGFILLAAGLVLVVAIVLWRLRDLRRYRALSTRDSLTGIANRRHSFERLENLLEGLAPGRGNLSVVLLDVDDFKAINDRHGHPVGDRVLQALAAALAGMLRPGDEVARVGGEEFLLVLPRTDRDGAVQVAARLRELLRELRVPAGGGALISVTASIGVATAGPGRDTPDALYAAADEALYRAKASGKNRFELAAAVC
ncbi:MAG: tetratricopeptide repeat-containing diguanylate cyclase [Pseudohaliea sp.]